MACPKQILLEETLQNTHTHRHRHVSASKQYPYTGRQASLSMEYNMGPQWCVRVCLYTLHTSDIRHFLGMESLLLLLLLLFHQHIHMLLSELLNSKMLQEKCHKVKHTQHSLCAHMWWIKCYHTARSTNLVICCNLQFVKTPPLSYPLYVSRWHGWEEEEEEEEFFLNKHTNTLPWSSRTGTDCMWLSTSAWTKMAI